MRRILAMAFAALVATTGVVVTSAGPASAVNVRYRAAQSCTVNGKSFHADIHTYGKPTPEGAPAYTEVQLWGFYFEAGAQPRRVEARKAVWRDGSWQDAGPLGYETDVVSGGWRAGNIDTKQSIGYITRTMPTAILIRGFAGPLHNIDMCRVILRPYDLYWVG
ncbi:hypothetical protein E1193_00155 [Micromonospora sp. KC606]|uniref:hypothetical protein n=1 Tax=Micromonospora sp. KC606 TaxID=2530379 RepID=UPI001046E1AE|nr:hypothetical protein [Micromonospora sp. KC606]TDC86124.1 hypothetical protein E1193_00155 [Micromonospora sp. KC606]